ncbi:MAG TPA: electron transfer flavoprotein subunit alpha/FixB family protein [Ktedonobacterales bacterium]|jgi:electron transfer flavoprotein alpha subunit|nr:electron transfer flavoprotein subunit alpha/FixB family protein [Ktedonobacterales bacterium]
MSNDIWALAELTNGRLANVSLQLASKATELAQTLGGKAAAVALGTNTPAAAQELGTCGVTTIYASEGAVYDEYLTQPHVDALAALIQQHQPRLILFGVTNYGRDIAARLAARLGLGLVYNVSEVTLDGGTIAMTVPAFGGSQAVREVFQGEGTMLLGARQNAFPTQRIGGSPTVEQVAAPAAPAGGAKLSGPFGTEGAAEAGHLGKAPDGHDVWLPAASRAKLEEAQIIVSGGRGLGGPEGFAQIEALAESLGASVGASRAAVDAGWIPYMHQVGQTGKTVKPTVYIACGISGAVQHKAGMGTAGLIIAINKDKDAPIFGFCDLGIVGDLNVVVPQLTAAVKQRKAGG